MWTSEKLESWKAASGKTWSELAQDIGMGERYLRKIRSGERKGAPALEKAERSERARTAKESIEALQQKLGLSRKELAHDLGVGERHLRKIVSGERASIPTVEKLFGEARRQEVETPRTEFFFKDMAANRIGKILAEMMPTWKGMRRPDIDKITKLLMEEEDVEDEIQNDAWKIARDLYDKSMGVPA